MTTLVSRSTSTGFFQPKRSAGKFTAVARAIKWLTERPGVEDANIMMAQKYMDIGSDPEDDSVQYNQAKCKYFSNFILLYRLVLLDFSAARGHQSGSRAHLGRTNR